MLVARQHTVLHSLTVDLVLGYYVVSLCGSLIPRPEEEEEKGSGFSHLHMHFITMVIKCQLVGNTDS